MEYNPKSIFEKAKEAITKHKLIFVEDICAFIGIAKSTYYVHIPVGSDYSNELNDLLEKNRIDIKVSLRKKWFDSDNPTLQMALYKLTSTKEEHKKLQQNYTDVTSNDETIGKEITPEQAAEFIKKIKED